MGIAKEKEGDVSLAQPVCQSMCKEPSHPGSPQSHKIGVIVIPIVQIRNWKPREVKKLVQVHIANK